MYCGNPLELPLRGNSNGFPQDMFGWIKVGFNLLSDLFYLDKWLFMGLINRIDLDIK